ncbi:MAG: hypothetical protein ACHQ50_06530 [Fimbriimonadales bacterium]
MNRIPLLIAAILCLGFAGPDSPKQAARSGQAGAKGPASPSRAVQPKSESDWRPTNARPVDLATRAEARYRTFDRVHLNVKLDLVCPLPPPELTGMGEFTFDSFFWTPKRFQIQYLVYMPAPPTRDTGYAEGRPTHEYVSSDGAGKILRHGPGAGPDSKFNKNSPLFNVSSDSRLVDVWPGFFPRLLLSSFTGGNATLSRYVKALVKGVGGYKVTTWERVLRGAGGTRSLQYRIYAERPKLGTKLESVVEIIFSGAKPYLPVMIDARLGPKEDAKRKVHAKYHLHCSVSWFNNAVMPKSVWNIG